MRAQLQSRPQVPRAGMLRASYSPFASVRLQRNFACGGSAGLGGDCEGCSKQNLQPKSKDPELETQGDAAIPPMIHEALDSPGKPLDIATRAFVEPRFSHDFGQVHVHTDARAASAASTVDARAYTVNRHIVFGAGEYAPQTKSGIHLLAHELSHVVQQGAGVHLKDGVGRDGDGYERQAESAAIRVAEGRSVDGIFSSGTAGPEPSSPPVVQFQKGDPKSKRSDGLDPTSNPALGVTERAKMLAEQVMKPKATPEIIKLAFLGATQKRGSWKEEVASRTNNVFDSLDDVSALAVINKHFDASPGPFDIRIAGYSWGGWTALQLASNLLISRKILDFFGSSVPAFTLSVSVLDPVSSFRGPLLVNPAAHSAKVFNIYQTNGCYGSRCAFGTSVGRHVFSGEPIPGATNKDVTAEGRSGPVTVNGVPSTLTPDHVHLGYERYGGHDKTVAAQLDA